MCVLSFREAQPSPLNCQIPFLKSCLQLGETHERGGGGEAWHGHICTFSWVPTSDFSCPWPLRYVIMNTEASACPLQAGWKVHSCWKTQLYNSPLSHRVGHFIKLDSHENHQSFSLASECPSGCKTAMFQSTPLPRRLQTVSRKSAGMAALFKNTLQIEGQYSPGIIRWATPEAVQIKFLKISLGLAGAPERAALVMECLRGDYLIFSLCCWGKLYNKGSVRHALEQFMQLSF